MAYTKGTKALVRQATASDYYEPTSVSNADIDTDADTDGQPKNSKGEKDKKPVNREAERRVSPDTYSSKKFPIPNSEVSWKKYKHCEVV